MKMLICDDDTMTLRALEFQFKKEGFELIKASNGREAQKLLTENNNIDVLITGLLMPFISGMELLIYVRKVLQWNIPIIMISRVNVEDTILQALEFGANDYLTKPFKLEELSGRVKKVLNNFNV